MTEGYKEEQRERERGEEIRRVIERGTERELSAKKREGEGEKGRERECVRDREMKRKGER